MPRRPGSGRPDRLRSSRLAVARPGRSGGLWWVRWRWRPPECLLARTSGGRAPGRWGDRCPAGPSAGGCHSGLSGRNGESHRRERRTARRLPGCRDGRRSGAQSGDGRSFVTRSWAGRLQVFSCSGRRPRGRRSASRRSTLRSWRAVGRVRRGRGDAGARGRADNCLAARRSRRRPGAACRGRRRSAAGGGGLAQAVREHAGRLRADAAAASVRAAGRAGVLMTAPLGICFLPAFLCLGLAPVVVGLLGQLEIF